MNRIDQNAKKMQRVTSMKIYLTNPTLRCALYTPISENDDACGEMAETAIYDQWILGEKTSFYYANWSKGRDKGEVDIVWVDAAFQNKAMEQLEGMIGTLRVYTSRLATKESYWIFHRDGDDFDLKVSDPKNPSYLLIANDPEMESIIGALNALILNRLVTRVNTGQGKNVPVSIIVDELPTLYFHKIDRLIGTARSNKVSVTLGFQELPQLESDYGKVGMQKIITTVGNVVSGSARAKETLEWLSNDIFGKVVQLKKGVTIDRDKTSINLNENLDSLVPASKISDMPTGWICGQTARDFIKTKTGRGDSMNIQESQEFQTTKFYCKTDFDMAAISKEESEYVPLPKFYTFPSREERERVLYKNFIQVGVEVKNMIAEIQLRAYAK